MLQHHLCLVGVNPKISRDVVITNGERLAERRLEKNFINILQQLLSWPCCVADTPVHFILKEAAQPWLACSEVASVTRNFLCEYRGCMCINTGDDNGSDGLGGEGDFSSSE